MIGRRWSRPMVLRYLRRWSQLRVAPAYTPPHRRSLTLRPALPPRHRPYSVLQTIHCKCGFTRQLCIFTLLRKQRTQIHVPLSPRRRTSPPAPPPPRRPYRYCRLYTSNVASRYLNIRYTKSRTTESTSPYVAASAAAAAAASTPVMSAKVAAGGSPSLARAAL
jgi:hypothetical protein